jgi:hypothetical protein
VKSAWSESRPADGTDHNDPSVASRCSPREAASRLADHQTVADFSWKEVAKLRITRPDIKLVSPAVAFDINWLKVCLSSNYPLNIQHPLTLQEFFSYLAKSEMPDYLAVHVYTTTFESFKGIIEEYWRTFNMPIIITEFAMQVCSSVKRCNSS